MILLLHLSVSFENRVFKIWRPLGVAREYIFMALSIFFYHTFSSQNQWLPLAPLLSMIIAFIGFIMEVAATNWAIEEHEIMMRTCIISGFFTSFLIFLDTLISKNGNFHQKFTLWTSILFLIVIRLVIQFFTRIQAKSTLKRLSLRTYKHEIRVKSAISIFRDLCIGLRYGSPNVLRMKFAKNVLKRFPNSLDISLFLFRQSFITFNPKISLRDIADRFHPVDSYNPIKSYIYESILHEMGPDSNEALEQMQRDIEDLNRKFHRLISSANIIYDMILNELTRNLPKLTHQFQYNYNKVIEHLFRFVQLYQGSPDAIFFVQLFSKLFPNSKEIDELKYWLNDQTNYLGIDISTFPSHLSAFMEDPDLFKNYRREYINEQRTIPQSIFSYDSIQTKNQQKMDYAKGPFKYVFHRIFFLVPFLISGLFPLIVMIITHFNCSSLHLMETQILNCLHLQWRIFQMNHCLYPSVIFKDDPSFWTTYGSIDQYMKSKLYDIYEFREDLMVVARGIGSYLNIDSSIFNTTRSIFSQTSEFNGNVKTLSLQLSRNSMIAEDFLTTENLYLDPTYNLSYAINELFSVLRSSNYVAQEVKKGLKAINILENSVFNFNINYLLIPEFIFLFIMLFALFWSLKNSFSKLELFLLTLRETGKSAITTVLSDLNKCQRLVSRGVNPKKKKAKTHHQFNFIFHFVIPMTVIYIIISAIIILYALYITCYHHQLENGVTVYLDFADIYNNISIIVIGMMVLDNYDTSITAPYERVTSIIANAYQTIDQTDLILAMQKYSFCPEINLLDMLIHARFDPELSPFSQFLYLRNDSNYSYYSHYALIFEWISLSQIWISNIPNNPETQTLNLINNFYLNVDPVFVTAFKKIQAAVENNLTHTQNILLIISTVYFVVLFIHFMFLEYIIHLADLPFNITVKMLSRLPENALSKDTEKILSYHSWNFESKRFVFDPKYYGKVLATLPDPIIVINRLMNIVYFNQAARSILHMPDNEIEAYQLLGKQKLNEALKIKLFGLPEDYEIEDSEAPLPTLEDIIKLYLFDGSDEVLTQRLSSIESGQKFWFSLTIQPIDNGDLSTSFIHKESDHFVLIFKDIGEEVRQQKMLEQEAERHFQLISQVLPAEIATKLLHEHHSISMTVDKVAISFCDIVSFTPWCGSQSPETVVNTLNYMFKLFDKMIARYDRVTKIKCIGDCYMSAAGIFSQGSNPDIAAEQMVQFGMDLPKGIEIVNNELNTSLQVRVGIAYGGPISAGVMGIHKPVFDIWGEIVNEANKMESSGKAMKVHITESLYNLVKNDITIDIEYSSDGTYFVSRK